MCTCITWENGSFYFGRNLDLDSSFGEKVVVTPRNFSLRFREGVGVSRHYAMIGMASANDSFPLYAEAVNEKGLGMAGLNFPGNAVYQEPAGQQETEAGPGKNGRAGTAESSAAALVCVASFEIIPWILSRCASVDEAEPYLRKMIVTNRAFAENMPPAPLHWMLADRSRCLVIEAVEEGLMIYDNPFGVLTNNPPFAYHRMNMNNYLNLTAESPANRFAPGLPLKTYAQGMGGLGLPGDASSASRFVRAAFLKWNSRAPEDEKSSVAQFFHILDGVAMVRGTVITEAGTYDITTYSCCVNTETGVYYYKTYDDSTVRSADMRAQDLDGDRLVLLDLL